MFDVQRFMSNVKKKEFFLIKTFVDSRIMIIFADHFKGDRWNGLLHAGGSLNRMKRPA